MDNKITIDIGKILEMPDKSVIDGETIRQIGLCSTAQYLVDKSTSNELIKKIHPLRCYIALYPEIIGAGNIELVGNEKYRKINNIK